MAKETKSSSKKAAASPGASGSSSSGTSASGSDAGTKRGPSPALDGALQMIERSHGKGAIMKLGDGTVVPIEGISTGSPSLDLALGGRGIAARPRRRDLRPESSGKTTLTSARRGERAEAGRRGRLHRRRARARHRVRREARRRRRELLISQPDTGEQALEIARSSCGRVRSTSSWSTRSRRSCRRRRSRATWATSQVGLQARLMSQALRKLTGAISRSNVTVIFINQLREKIGVMFGSPETTTGGRALKFYASVRMDIRRIGAVKDGGRRGRQPHRVKVVKNKVAPPFRRPSSTSCTPRASAAR
jgi:recombination protein RecA